VLRASCARRSPIALNFLMSSSQDFRGRDRSLYQRLHVAQEDLRQAAYFAEYILKKGWHSPPWERRWTTYMQQSAYITALVVAYARPFTESRGWPKLPKRLLTYTAEQKFLHKRVMELRNEIYAHSDVAKRNVRPIAILGRPSAIEKLPPMMFTKDETQMLLMMIRAVSNAINARLAELIHSAQDET